ncbi:unnamed protein product [Prunus armeniaca]|uniref:NAC domain-containing protein n=1 Tax=Prunus armeniaca TaxID=36596 RepID=A0A6J5U4R6_PRUAR|nr:unnamed protein product [Prunus armeniaca]CAB4300783.1 unnamed protein product [Prunus armeniaca]
MAATAGSSSSFAAAADDPALALPSVLNVKLDPTNYPSWLAQIVPLLRSRRLISFVDGTSICPPAFLPGADGKPTNVINAAHEDWIQMDQLVLSWINGSLSHPVLATVASSISARATWLALAALLSTPVPVSDHGTAAMVGSGGCGSGGGEMSSSSTTGEGDSKQMDLPGYKFSPTEEELVGFYLKKKIEGKDAKFRRRIPVIDVYNHKPSDLPAFFFSQPDYKYKNSKRCNRSTDEGFYKSTGKVREIKAEQSQAVIGNKRILSYYEGRAPQAKKTKYVMHEYSLTKTKLAQLGAQNNQQRELVLCHLTNKPAKVAKLKDDSISGDELAEPAIVGEIACSKDDQAAATDMIQGPDEHLADKDALLGTENRNECAEPSCADLGENMDSTFLPPEQLAATSATTPTSATSFGGFGVGSPDGFLLSDIDDLLKEPSCADLGENMDSTFLPPEQLAATSATTPTSATSFGGFGVGSPDGFLLSDFDVLFKEPFCADQPDQPPHPPHPHQPSPAPQSHQPPPPSQPQNYCSSTLPSASCTKQGNVPGLYNDDCSKQLSPTGNNISTNYHYEPVSNTAYGVQNGATDERFSEVYKISTNDHNESVSSEAYFQQEENLGSIFHPIRPQDYTLLSPRNTELGDVMHASNYIGM